jgi:hypothetical protein
MIEAVARILVNPAVAQDIGSGLPPASTAQALSPAA